MFLVFFSPFILFSPVAPVPYVIRMLYHNIDMNEGRFS